MEPCSHHGSTPPCTEAVLAAGVARVVAGSLDPNPEAGGGLELLRSSGRRGRARPTPSRRGAQNEAWRTWVAERPAVRDLQGRLDARRPRHRSRRALGQRRGVAPARPRAARRLGRGRGRHGHGPGRRPAARRARRGRTAAAAPARVRPRPAPAGVGARAAKRALREELAALATEGVQSLLLEGGPTLAGAFLAEGLVDKLLVFVAPSLAGAGPVAVAGLDTPATLRRLTARRVGQDLLVCRLCPRTLIASSTCSRTGSAAGCRPTSSGASSTRSAPTISRPAAAEAVAGAARRARDRGERRARPPGDGAPARRSKPSPSASALTLASSLVFTGIVRERGRVLRVDGGADGLALELEAPADGCR